jgi:predicted HTH transcriptional regulator
MLPRIELRREVSAEEWLRRGEGEDLEVKASAFSHSSGRRALSDQTPRRSPADAFAELLKAIVGFLNSSGGTLIIGATEAAWAEADTHGDAVRIGTFLVGGIDEEIGRNVSEFDRRLRTECRTRIEPDPTALVTTRWERVGDRTVCILDIRAPRGASAVRRWFYYRGARRRPEFFVRRGTRTQLLVGVEVDAYRRNANLQD